MIAYKEWGYQLYPGIAFEDLTSRTEKLGGKARIRDLMRELRDKERDRVIEAKYGRPAVDNVHAQEAAKAAGNVSVIEEEVEEEEDEKRANSRYMDVDGNRLSAISHDESTESHTPDQPVEADTSAILSAKVRERMEANRRLALERLRLKKEETAVATRIEERTSADEGAPLDDEEVDMMDVDDKLGAGNDFEDDEAALAEMEAENIVGETKSISAAATTETPSTVATINDSASRDAGANTEIPGIAGTVRAERDTSSASREGVQLTIKEKEAGSRASSPSVHDGKHASASGEGVAQGLQNISPMRTDFTGDSLNKDTNAGEQPVGEAGSSDIAADSSVVFAMSPVRQKAHTDDARTERLAKDSSASSSLGAAVEMTVGASDGTKTIAEKETPAEQAAVRSPVGKKLAGDVPMSPLCSLFADTDTPAEGASVAARAPMGGLLTDENF